jgi:hypothetical protein
VKKATGRTASNATAKDKESLRFFYRECIDVTEQAIEFLQDWVHEKVEAHPVRGRHKPLPLQAAELSRECERDAAAVGVTHEDIEEEVGNLDDLMATKIQDAEEKGRQTLRESR